MEVGIKSTGDDLLGIMLISRLCFRPRCRVVEDRPAASLRIMPHRTAMVEYREMTAVL